MQVVYMDIEKYSMRKPLIQISVMNAFTDVVDLCLHKAIDQYQHWEDGYNAYKDIVILPTGDGMALAFTFSAITDLHWIFSKKLMQDIHDFNNAAVCPIFEQQHWCDCHPMFNIRIGIAEGRGILYKDIKKDYNVAGNTINTAARIMDLADGKQILLSELAFQNVIGMERVPDLERYNRLFKDVEVKHGKQVNVYQYCPLNQSSINTDVSCKLKAIKPEGIQ